MFIMLTMLILEFQAKVSRFDSSNVYQHYLSVPIRIADQAKDLGINRFVALINDFVSLRCAILSAGEGNGYYILLNKDLIKSLKLQIGDEVKMKLTEDKSKYGADLPEEIEELFYQEPEFDRYFHELSPGKQRGLLHLVNKIKTPSKRVEKAIIISRYLIESRGELDYKELNAAFRRGI